MQRRQTAGCTPLILHDLEYHKIMYVAAGKDAQERPRGRLVSQISRIDQRSP
jgi:hypothetical protein